ncbi:hypothetical protein F5884DRAFT_746225 [Xylogone sp. PMI_703]|nr:hypothetical protein F5884DRAFT_746225 [Xylogone sp. PMI_703]
MPKESNNSRGPGRPRADQSTNPYENKRRQQLRNAQQSYRRRKEAEIADLRTQTKDMQVNAAKLSESLLTLLDNVIQDSTSLNPAIYNSIITSVKHMLPIADAISQAGSKDEPTALTPESLDKGSVTIDKDNQPLEPNTPSLEITTKASSIQEPSFTTDNQLSLSNPQAIHGSLNLPKYNTPDIFRDWFSPNYLLPEIPVDCYPEAPLAVRITYTALRGVSHHLHDPKTSANVGSRIFPFQTGPVSRSQLVSKVDQLMSITEELLAACHCSTLNDSDTSDTERPAVKAYFKNKSYYQSEDWRRKYGQWFSAYDVEAFIRNNFAMMESAEQYFINTQLKRIEGVTTDLLDVEGGMSIVSIRKSDLINGIIGGGVCLEDVPSFRVTDVKDTLKGLIQRSMIDQRIVQT